jgi:hypothetical protein
MAFSKAAAASTILGSPESIAFIQKKKKVWIVQFTQAVANARGNAFTDEHKISMDIR